MTLKVPESQQLHESLKEIMQTPSSLKYADYELCCHWWGCTLQMVTLPGLLLIQLRKKEKSDYPVFFLHKIMVGSDQWESLLTRPIQ